MSSFKIIIAFGGSRRRFPLPHNDIQFWLQRCGTIVPLSSVLIARMLKSVRELYAETLIASRDCEPDSSSNSRFPFHGACHVIRVSRTSREHNV
jgi:hypothetical protein